MAFETEAFREVGYVYEFLVFLLLFLPAAYIGNKENSGGRDMRSQSDDREKRDLIEPVLRKLGYEVISFRGIDVGDYWIHIRKEGPS